MLMVLIIIGVLSVLALGRYGSVKESAFDKEAKANLKLIMAAEKIYRMEAGFYYNSGSTQLAAINGINTQLKLLLSAANNRIWNYHTTVSGGSSCAQATRTLASPDDRTFRMRSTESEPVEGAACP